MQHLQDDSEELFEEEDNSEIQIEKKSKSAARPLWKSQYCVWTHFGDWLSDDCYFKRSDSMVSKNMEKRRNSIDELCDHGLRPNWIRTRKSGFIAALNGVWAEIAKNGNPEEFLQGDHSGIHPDHYESRFELKLHRDFVSAQDSDFRNRYINGYEFPAVPKFRQDTASWNGFVRSWCESVSLEAGKKSPRSLLVKRITAAAKVSGIDIALEPMELLDWLRKSWKNSLSLVDEKNDFGQTFGGILHFRR